MGCDIHGYVEFRARPDQQFDCFAAVSIPRNYSLFGLLAGVRDKRIPPIVPPRGLTSDDRLSWGVINEYTLYIVSDRADRGEIEAKYARTCQDWNGYRVVHPDWHNPSWLTLDEVLAVKKRFLDQYKDDHIAEFQACCAAMQELERHGFETRFAFWFDN